MSVEFLESPLGEVFIAQHGRLRRIAMKIVGTADLADDIMQDAYLKLVGVCPTQVDKPYSYCCQVVRNLALDHCRRQAVEASYRVYSKDGELPPVPGINDPDRALNDRRLLEAISAALATLPARTQRVFELYRLAGMTQREIAKEQGCSATLVNFMVKDAVQVLMNCQSLLEGDWNS